MRGLRDITAAGSDSQPDPSALLKETISRLGLVLGLEWKILAIIASYALAIGLFSLIVPLTVQEIVNTFAFAIQPIMIVTLAGIMAVTLLFIAAFKVLQARGGYPLSAPLRPDRPRGHRCPAGRYRIRQALIPLPNPAIYGVRLTCKDLAFAYPDAAPAFQGFNLEVAPGEKVAVLSATSTGKTPLAAVAFSPALCYPNPGAGSHTARNPLTKRRPAFAARPVQESRHDGQT